MTIAAKCPGCGVALKVASKMAGRTGRCPRCGAEVRVPGPIGNGAKASAQAESKRPRQAATAAAKAGTSAKARFPQAARNSAEERTRIRRAALAALNGEIAPPRRSFGYLFALPLAAAVMVLLPLLYVALVGLAGYGVYYHWTEHVVMVQWGYGRLRILSVIAYVGIGFAGAVVTLFLIKPLFARPAREVRTRSLTPQGEPYLFRFVRELCELVGAPMPKRIDVDYQFNASAGFRRGMLSLVGADLVLTIGAPFVAGFTVSQFAGVLAHELGHFRQGMGMRLSYLVRSINAWFARVVYMRDEWDVWLQETANDVDIRIGWVLHLASFGVYLSRVVLWGLMMIGHAVCGLLLRQMEYDADRVSVQVTGSKCFELRRRKTQLLGFAYACAEQQVMGFLARRMYPDDIAQFMLMIAKETPQEVRDQLSEAMDKVRTHWLDTHPCDADRIRSAQREDAPGILHSNAPAAVLFDHFPALCRNVTWDLYSLIPRASVRPQDLRPVRELLADEQAGRIAERKARDETPIPLD